MARKKKKGRRILAVLLTLLLAGGAAAAWLLFVVVLKPNVKTGDKKSVIIFIPTGSDYETLKEVLYEQENIKNRKTFEFLAARKNLPAHVNPGRYRILKGMGNNEVINMLRAGLQEPVKLVINSFLRTKHDLAGVLGNTLEPDSLAFLSWLNNADNARSYGFDNESVMTMILPDTYEFYWNTSTDDFFKRMAEEYRAFWTTERKQQAKDAGLSQTEVSILASIVQRETSKQDEKPDIAGVYINRLEIGMPLQADPTLIFALGDFSIKRVLNVHKEIDSPYNTYKYRGLPPGPISLASKNSIDAVLNYRDHAYLYFVAKADFSGYHSFSRNYQEHLRKAREYQRELNRRRIMK